MKTQCQPCQFINLSVCYNRGMCWPVAFSNDLSPVLCQIYYWLQCLMYSWRFIKPSILAKLQIKNIPIWSIIYCLHIRRMFFAFLLQLNERGLPTLPCLPLLKIPFLLCCDVDQSFNWCRMPSSMSTGPFPNRPWLSLNPPVWNGVCWTHMHITLHDWLHLLLLTWL